MRKLMIIAPALLITPMLIGCKNKNAYSFVFNSDYCTLDNKSEYPKDPTEEVTLTMKLKEEYNYCAVPDDVIVIIGREEASKGEQYEFTPSEDKKEATIKLAVTDDIIITAKFSDSDNAFRINPSKYDEAIDLNGSDTKYVQRAYVHLIISINIVTGNYIEEYSSPTVYNRYDRQIYSHSEQTPPSEYYIEKNGNNYYEYKRESSSAPWEKKDAQESYFLKPTDLSFRRLIVDLGGVTYDVIKDHYDPMRQAYYFPVTVTSLGKDYTYDVIMSFYNNQLTFFSYYFINEYSQTELGTISYTYGEITPKLPKVS